MLSVVYAIVGVDQVLNSFLLTETLATYFGISLLGGLIWRRANRWGAASSFFVALGVNFSMHWLRGARLDAFDPIVFGLALSSGIVALVVVSLLTRREGANADELFDRLDTPVELEGAPAADARAQAAARGEALLLPNLLRLRQAASGQRLVLAYRSDLGGFAVAWLVVGAVIGGTWLFLRIGG
jgi:hypothetical protein